MRLTQWQQLENLVGTLLDLPPAERPKFLEEACRGDQELRRQVEELAASFAEAGNFLEDAIGATAQRSLLAAALAAAPVSGDRLGPYELAGEIGRGGMGMVFQAFRADDQYRQQVAIKIIGAGLQMSPDLISRFRAERQILAILSHPNIARLLDGGLTDGGLPYLVMEFIEGEPIDRFVQERHLNIRSRLELFRKVCSATQYAHQNLIVHRDIKPANVMVTPDGEPKLLDFGIAKLLEPGSFGQTIAHTAAAERLMTPGYASPEQIRGEAITTATDVYALGVLLYQLLTGKPAYETNSLSPANIERLICDTRPPSASTLALERISPDLDNVVMKAMHKEPARRYVSAAELADDVRRYLEGLPVSARPDSWSYRTSKFVTRHKLGVAVAALVLITIAGLGAGLIVQTVNARREARTAQGVASFLTSLFRASRPDVTQGRKFSARDILDMGAARIPRELSGEPDVQARLLVTIGGVYYSLGAFDQAENLGKQAIDLSHRIRGGDPLLEAESKAFVLGQVALARGKYDEATRYIDPALSLLEKHPSPGLANLLVISGLANWHKGDLDTAEARLREAIRLDINQKGAEHRDTLGAQGNLGLVLLDKEEYAAAQTLQRENLAVRLRTLGPDHPDVAINTANVGDIERETEQWQQAEKIYRTALERYRKVYGPDHPRYATPLNMIAEIQTYLGHYDDALSLNARALDLAVRAVGPLTTTTGQILLTRGFILTNAGKPDEARPFVTKALSILAKIYPAGDLHTAEANEIRGELELAEGDLKSAKQDFAQGLEIRTKRYGHKGLHVASSLVHLADVLAAQGDYPAAEAAYRDAIQTAQIKWAGPSTTVARALFGLGKALMAEGKQRAAITPLQESLEMRRKLLPPGHPDIGASVSALGH